MYKNEEKTEFRDFEDLLQAALQEGQLKVIYKSDQCHVYVCFFRAWILI